MERKISEISAKIRGIKLNKRHLITGVLLVLITWIIFNLHRNYSVTRYQLVNITLEEIPVQLKGQEERHDRWIVVTTISSPTKDIRKLAQIKGWKVVVVGDVKTPKNWSFPGCTFLDVDQQLPYQLANHLPLNSYTRKNLGYLYAIQHGARYIYDTDDDNHPTNGRLNFQQNPWMTGLVYDKNTGSGSDVMNPYAHFGKPTIWPRGYPLDAIDIPNGDSYRLTIFRTPAIQQGLVNGDPDVDAIFRLTRKRVHTSPINITFDVRAPPVVLPRGILAPFNSQNTFFSYDAFWALFLPSSVAFRVTDIWRGYWSQRLLWLLGHKLAFFLPNAVQLRNAHNYLDDFRDENQFYTQSGSLVAFLTNWTCDKNTFFGCVSCLCHDMADEGFWQRSDAVSVDVWLRDLTSIGYRQPRCRSANWVPTDCRITSNLSGDEPSNNATSNRVYFVANVGPDPPFGPSRPSNDKLDLNAFCHQVIDFTPEHGDIAFRRKPRIVFDDKLLIIVFNLPHYDNIRILDALYRDHFPNMVYCGQTSSREELERDIMDGHLHSSFINITSSGGYFGYECAIRAMQMNYDVNGYIIVGDDVMFNFWNFHQLDPDVARLTVPSYRTMDIDVLPNQTHWQWWGSSFGRIATKRALREMQLRSTMDNDQNTGTLLKQYLTNRFSSKLDMTNISLSLGDIYYIPQSVSQVFVAVMSIFLKHQVFLEIAIPTTIAGLYPTLEHLKDRLMGRSIWGGERNKPFDYFNPTTDYLHPLKLSTVFNNISMRKEYCRNYIHHLLQNW